MTTWRATWSTNRRAASNGRSLKDFDLNQRLFANRCSYMIYSPVFTALPAEIKLRVWRELASALRDDGSAHLHLAPEERRTIRTILKETIPDLPGEF